jgi:TRAP-type C4-dicarboxylate transport system permease small subunit
MMVLNVIDIVASKWFKWSIPGALDFSEELMVFLTILPIAYIALERGHIIISVVEERLSQKTRFALLVLRYAMGTLVMGFITWRVFTQFQNTVVVGQLKEGVNFPIWPANLAVVLGFGFLALVWLLLLVKTVNEGAEQ